MIEKENKEEMLEEDPTKKAGGKFFDCLYAFLLFLNQLQH